MSAWCLGILEQPRAIFAFLFRAGPLELVHHCRSPPFRHHPITVKPGGVDRVVFSAGELRSAPGSSADGLAFDSKAPLFPGYRFDARTKRSD